MTNGHGGPREAGAGKKMGAPPMAARLAKAGGPKGTASVMSMFSKDAQGGDQAKGARAYKPSFLCKA
jgi:hypothetical protein